MIDQDFEWFDGFIKRHQKEIDEHESSLLTQEFYSSDSNDAVDVEWPIYLN